MIDIAISKNAIFFIDTLHLLLNIAYLVEAIDL